MFQEIGVDQSHEIKVQWAFTLGLVIKAGTVHTDQLTLLTDAQRVIFVHHRPTFS
jgi:hypothetical protein